MPLGRVRIPADFNTENIIFSVGPVKLSPRQLMLVGGGLLIWYGSAKFMLKPIIGLNTFFGMLALCWIPAVCLALAFAKPKGRPLDVLIGEKLAFRFAPDTFIMKDDDSGQLNASLDDDEDINALLEYHRNQRRRQ